MDVKEIVKQLKLVKEQRSLTFQEISDATAENGEYVSVSTIKNVWSGKHEPDYNKTVKPIARVLLGDVNSAEMDVFLAISEYKDGTIKQLERRVLELQAYCELLARRNDSMIRRYEGYEKVLVEQLEFHKEQIKRLSETVERKDAVIRTKLWGEKNDEEEKG